MSKEKSELWNEVKVKWNYLEKIMKNDNKEEKRYENRTWILGEKTQNELRKSIYQEDVQDHSQLWL